MQCNECGYMLSAFETECPRCKNLEQHLEQHRVIISPLPLPGAPVAESLDAATISCPCCTGVNVQKVAAIVKAGAWSGTAPLAPLAAQQGVGGTTQLVSALALSPPPAVRSLVGTLLGFLVTAGVTVGCFVLALSQNDRYTPERLTLAFCTTFFGSLFFACMLIVNKKHNEVAAEKIAQWEDIYPLWERLWYCHKCDSVFDPETRQHAPSQHMPRLLKA